MHDAPNPAQIVDAAARFLREDAAGALAGEGDVQNRAYLGYVARVIGNLLAIAARQMAEPPAVAEAEHQGLRALLAEPGAGPGAGAGDSWPVTPQVPPASIDALNRELVQRIADGRLGLHTPGLAAQLWRVTLAKLAVDQPGYATYRARMAAAPARTPVPPPPDAPGASGASERTKPRLSST